MIVVRLSLSFSSSMAETDAAADAVASTKFFRIVVDGP